jgi:O-antigen/teichoic acid export membrane protein
MSIAKQIAFGAVSGWFSRAVSILLGLFLMPVLFRHLGREELGVWLLLGQSWAILGILDLGLSATLTRRIAFAVGKRMATSADASNDQDACEMADLIETGRKLYHMMAFGSFLVAFGIGIWGLHHLHLSSLAMPRIYLAWGILCFSQSVTVFGSTWSCVLQGIGYVGWETFLGAFVNSVSLALQIVVVLAGGGLIGLAIVATLGALAQRLLVMKFTRRKNHALWAMRGVWRPALVKSMAPVSLRAWVTSVSLVIVLNTDQFFIAGLRGAAQIPAYRAAYSIFINLQMLSVALAASSGVFIAQLWQAGAVQRVHRIVSHNLRLGLSVMVTGGGCVLGLGQRLFNVWIGHGNFIGMRISCVFFLLLFLETQSFIIATSSRATEDEAFALCAVTAAVLNIALSFTLGVKFGLFGIALATLIAQLATSHWFMCYRGLRRLQLSLRSHFTEVLTPIGILFGFTFGLVRGASILMAGYRDWMAVVVAMLIAGSLLGCSIWLLVLDKSQRQVAAAFPARLVRATLG